MAKSRMNKAEKAFIERISAIVFATPEIRNGQRYLDRKAFATLTEADRQQYLDLLIGKTR